MAITTARGSWSCLRAPIWAGVPVAARSSIPKSESKYRHHSILTVSRAAIAQNEVLVPQPVGFKLFSGKS